MKTKRRKYFIDRGFQTEFILKFCGLIVVGCVLFGAILYVFSSPTLTTSFENSRLVVKSTADYLIPGLLFGGIIVGLMMALACSIVVLFMTHRIAGPIYRFERYAEKVGRGELCPELKIRKKDQFHNLAGAFSKMVEDLRRGLLEIIKATEMLDTLIDRFPETKTRDALVEKGIDNIVSELRKYRESLKKAISYFRV